MRKNPRVDSEGNKWWLLNGNLHREDGPAIEWSSGSKQWFINGNRLTEELFNEVTNSPVEDLSKYQGLGFDDYISERLKDSSMIKQKFIVKIKVFYYGLRIKIRNIPANLQLIWLKTLLRRKNETSNR